jgi:hypothetical protein
MCERLTDKLDLGIDRACLPPDVRRVAIQIAALTRIKRHAGRRSDASATNTYANAGITLLDDSAVATANWPNCFSTELGFSFFPLIFQVPLKLLRRLVVAAQKPNVEPTLPGRMSRA